LRGISQLFRALEDGVQAIHIVIPESMFRGNHLPDARLVGSDAHGYVKSNLLSPQRQNANFAGFAGLAGVFADERSC
jgi:hypothetical protein